MKLGRFLAVFVLCAAAACDGARVVQIEDPGDEGLSGQRDGGTEGPAGTDAGVDAGPDAGPTDAGATDAGAFDGGGQGDAGSLDGGAPVTCAPPQHAVSPGAKACQAIDPSGAQCAKTVGYGLLDGECQALAQCAPGAPQTQGSIFDTAAECALHCAAAGFCQSDKLPAISGGGCDEAGVWPSAQSTCIGVDLEAVLGDPAGVDGTWACGLDSVGHWSCPDEGPTCCGRGATWSVPDAALRFCALSLLPSVQELACIVYL